VSANLIFKEECYKIVGASFEVYKEKGCGFVEAVYQECLQMELEAQGIPFVAQSALKLQYKGRPLVSAYQADLICFGTIIVELKAVTEITDQHRAQLQNYLKATNLTLGILVNFGHYPGVEVERLVSQQGRFLKRSGATDASETMGK
jgi:GxxExxY protein